MLSQVIILEWNGRELRRDGSAQTSKEVGAPGSNTARQGVWASADSLRMITGIKSSSRLRLILFRPVDSPHIFTDLIDFDESPERRSSKPKPPPVQSRFSLLCIGISVKIPHPRFLQSLWCLVRYCFRSRANNFQCRETSIKSVRRASFWAKVKS